MDLQLLLDKIYELEGLVVLATKREDDTHHLHNLIKRKAKEVKELCEKLEIQPVEVPTLDKRDQTASKDSFNFQEYQIEEEKNGLNNTDIQSEIISPISEKPIDISNDPKKGRGKLVFTINDRFRFRRELFDNSDADFNNTLALVASMENYEEAEDFFINEEGFNPKEKVVEDFLSILKKYFK